MNNNNSGNVKYSSVSSGDYDEDDPSKYRRGNYSSNSSRSSTSNKNSVSFTNIFGSKSDEMGGASSSSSSMMFKSMIKEQDDNLERLEESTSRLSDMSLSMSNEIDMQNRMLNNLEVEMQTAQLKTDAITASTRELVKRAGGCQNLCIIITLSVILAILVFLVIYS